MATRTAAVVQYIHTGHAQQGTPGLSPPHHSQPPQTKAPITLSNTIAATTRACVFVLTSCAFATALCVTFKVTPHAMAFHTIIFGRLYTSLRQLLDSTSTPRTAPNTPAPPAPQDLCHNTPTALTAHTPMPPTPPAPQHHTAKALYHDVGSC